MSIAGISKVCLSSVITCTSSKVVIEFFVGLYCFDQMPIAQR